MKETLCAAAVALAAVFAAPSAGAVASAAPISPTAVNLRPNDAPPGYAASYSNAALVYPLLPLPAAGLDAPGALPAVRYRASVETFATPGCTPHLQVMACTWIESRVLVLGSAAYAHAAYARAGWTTIAPLSYWHTAGVGQEGRRTGKPVTATTPGGAPWVGPFAGEEEHVVLFRRGPVLVILRIVGPAGQVSASSYLRYAWTIDARIRQALA